jgi:hypothetical protein
MRCLAAYFILLSGTLCAEEFSCPAGQADVMKYFVMGKENRARQFMSGAKNPIYTEVFPNRDFAEAGYWFWLKSPAGHGFDVKAYDKDYIFMRATELVWTDNTTFKRFVRDLPIAARCVPEGQPGPEIRVRDTSYRYYSSCKVYKQSQLGTALNSLDAPALMDTGGNIGQVWTRVLHYRYHCNTNFQQCLDEEQFYLADGFGEWQWKHYKNGTLVNSTLINNMIPGTAHAGLPCSDSYRDRTQDSSTVTSTATSEP